MMSDERVRESVSYSTVTAASQRSNCVMHWTSKYSQSCTEGSPG